MQLLDNTNKSAHFSPYEIVIDWGFSSLRPEPSLEFDLLNPDELSTCIHEFTHLDGMNSEMGLWYLHSFWKFISMVFSKKSALHLLQRYELFERFWFLSILLEGQAMFAQLDLLPSNKIEATTRQYTFIINIAKSYGIFNKSSFSNIQNTINELFINAQEHVHVKGLKRALLFSTKNSTYHYFLGYLFIKNIQAYLSQYNSSFKDPEIFFIFINNFLFNNIFSSYRLNDTYRFSSSSAVSKIIHGIKIIAKNSTKLLSPILNYPKHELNYRFIDYLKTSEESDYIARNNLNDITYEYVEDLIKIDEYYANLFAQSAISLGFYHLKSIDAYIIGFIKNKSHVILYCKYNDQKTICALQINEKTKKLIEDLIKREKCLILYRDIDSLGEDKIDTCIDKYLECEVHIVTRLDTSLPFTCIVTEKEFIPILESNNVYEIWRDNQFLLKKVGYTEELVNKSINQSSYFSDELLWHFGNSEYVRSRKCRNRVINYFLEELDKIEKDYYNQLKNEGIGSPNEKNPETIQMKAKENTFFAFECALFPVKILKFFNRPDDENPLIQAFKSNNMLSQLQDYCLVSPYKFKKLGTNANLFKNINEIMCSLFSGNLFFEKGINRLDIFDFF